MKAINWLSRAQRSPIGVDVGTRTLKAVQVTTSHAMGGVTVVATAVVPRADADAPFGRGDVDRLLPVLIRQGFRGRDVVVAAPAGLLESDLVELPSRSSGAPVDELAAAEIGRLAKLGAGTYEAACWDVPVARTGAGAGTSVLAVALRHIDAEALVAPFDLTGYRVRAIDTPACAVARACGEVVEASETDAPAERLTAVLDLGWRAGAVTLLAGGDVLYHRVLHECGIGPLYRQLASRHEIGEAAADYLLCHAATELPAAEPLVRGVVDAYVGQASEELGASLAFARHRYAGRAVTNVSVVGGGAKVKGLCERLTSVARLPVAPLRVPGFLRFAAGQLGEAEWPQVASAVGLALHPEAVR